MKSTIKDQDERIEYPCLMRGEVSGIIYLMRSKKRGTIVGGSERLGEQFSDLIMTNSEIFHGTVTLENN